MSLKKIVSALSIALTVATVGLAASGVSPASAATTLYGGVTRAEDGKTIGGASLYVYRYTTSGWQNLGYKGSTNSAGSYSVSGLVDGYWYSVRAYKAFGICQSGQAVYDGFSASTQGTGGSRPVKVVVKFQGYIYC